MSLDQSASETSESTAGAAFLASATRNVGHEIAMSLRGAYLALHRLADADFAVYGITADQFPVLVVLSDGSVLTQSEVCRRSHTDPNTMGSMLALMQTRGLVRRMRHSTDGRVRTVALTPKGKRVFLQALSGTQAAHRGRLGSLFTEAEVKVFLRFLKRINQELSLPPRSRRRLKNKTLAATVAT